MSRDPLLPTKDHEEAAPALEQGLEHIGLSLQTLRREQDLTLQELAERCGFSAGYLSQIETGAAVPSLTALQVIAAELGVEVATFFPDERRHGTRLIRAADRHEVRLEPGSGEVYAILAGQVTGRAFSALYARHLSGASGSERPFRHLGEEFGLILAGTLAITIEGETYELGPGDWIHYSSHPSHSAHVVSSQPVEALWLLTPGVV
ncbi:MAG: helix-turn-helix domain-containing protein [Actinomycetota bacterium]|nr:helix-turn-helix domain-containing protein [Actinomycetota bacterium]